MSITEICFSCSLDGDNFDPTPFLDQTQFEITDYHFRGEVDKRKGREGRIFKYSYILLQSHDADFEVFIHELYAIKHLIIASQPDSIVLHIDLWYTGHCNWEIKPNVLKMLGELDLTLAISSIENDEEEEVESEAIGLTHEHP